MLPNKKAMCKIVVDIWIHGFATTFGLSGCGHLMQYPWEVSSFSGYILQSAPLDDACSPQFFIHSLSTSSLLGAEDVQR